jgi:branched-subunit amino acid aminotransferase/4-amino-4-deoxychorismate lyase
LDAVPLDDRGLLLGDGLFETLLWRDGDFVLAEAHAAAGADEAVMLNTRDEIAGAAAANVFWAKDDRLFAPPWSMAARRLGIDYQELTCGAEVLASADAILLTSSLVGVRPAARGRRPGLNPSDGRRVGRSRGRRQLRIRGRSARLECRRGSPAARPRPKRDWRPPAGR